MAETRTFADLDPHDVQARAEQALDEILEAETAQRSDAARRLAEANAEVQLFGYRDLSVVPGQRDEAK
jgi:hypothetical protein